LGNALRTTRSTFVFAKVDPASPKMPVRLGPMPKESPQALYLDADFEAKIDPNHQAGVAR
jgi:hypothetical protein